MVEDGGCIAELEHRGPMLLHAVSWQLQELRQQEGAVWGSIRAEEDVCDGISTGYGWNRRCEMEVYVVGTGGVDG